MAENRTKTTMSCQERTEGSYGLREFLDDFGPMSNITRLLKGHDDEIPSMPSGLGGLGLDALGSDSDGKSSGRIAKLKEAELKQFAKILEGREAKLKNKKRKQTGMADRMAHRGRKAASSADKND